jgi:hypothetical protein
MTTKTFRAGDVVKHMPSGETWTLAYGEGRDVSAMGWPESIARAADCELVEAASDEEHVKALCEVASIGPDERGRTDHRASVARRQLAAMSGPVTRPDTPAPAVCADEADDLRSRLALAEADRAALLRFIRDRQTVCDYCEATPVCIGADDGEAELLMACGEHCRHGGEDGWCLMLPTEDANADE